MKYHYTTILRCVNCIFANKSTTNEPCKECLITKPYNTGNYLDKHTHSQWEPCQELIEQ